MSACGCESEVCACEAHESGMSAAAAALIEDGSFISQADRDKAAKSGEAMADGSYPVLTCSGENSVDSAIKAVGRGKGDHNAIRKHIITRAKALGCSDKIPDNWKPDGSMKDSTNSIEAAGEAADLPDTAGMNPRWHAYLFCEGLFTTDGRGIFADEGTGTWRDLPLPLKWQPKSEPGHGGAIVVGSIDTIARQEQPGGYALLYAEGTWDLGGEHGIECARQVALQGGMRWVSADVEPLESDLMMNGEITSFDDAIDKIFDGDNDFDDLYEVLTSYRLMAATVVAEPAFPQCVIAPINIPLPQVDPMTQAAPVPPPPPSMLIASIDIPVVPPRSWFERAEADRPTALTVTDEGAVYGHIAEWGTCHTGINGTCMRPPRSHTGYANFLTGDCVVDDGERIPVGQLTMGCGHAGPSASARIAAAHYDGGPGAIQMADVTIRDGIHGIWVCGALKPNRTPEQIREFMALAPSGDWRKIGGHLELVASVQVPVPGFPIPRALAASAGWISELVEVKTRAHRVRDGEEWEVVSLVAAGRVYKRPAWFSAVESLANEVASLKAEMALLRPAALSALDQRFALTAVPDEELADLDRRFGAA